MFNLIFKQWRYLLAIIVIVDMLVVGGVLYFITVADSLAGTPMAAATPVVITPTPWPGPGPRPTATPTLPPTAIPTIILGPSGFPLGFTPTPRPTREPVQIKLPQIYRKNTTDVPVINQIYYPEPFFPPGTNNACGPVSLYAAMQGLNVNIDYIRLRNTAVSYGFNAEGISKWGLINTAVTLNYELGSPLAVESSDHYRLKDLMAQLRQGGVIVVLLQVRRGYNGYYVTADPAGAIGHFLLVESISLKSKKVRF
ncbi:MAG: hypothetical protein AB1801_17750, partial [Chloroflexota bacterium]